MALKNYIALHLKTKHGYTTMASHHAIIGVGVKAQALALAQRHIELQQHLD